MVAVCGLLVLSVALVFAQSAGHSFVNFDDPDYVQANPMVAHGVTAEGIAWSFTHFHNGNWHPLTWLSHMLDCQFYGLNHPAGHHLTSVLLHAINTLLLFFVLRNMTGDLWPAAFAAALFGVHPLHVESVAWIAERKDALSGLFFMLSLAAYAGYARRPFSIVRYLLVTLTFVFGLMAKPMLVTLPFACFFAAGPLLAAEEVREHLRSHLRDTHNSCRAERLRFRARCWKSYPGLCWQPFPAR